MFVAAAYRAAWDRLPVRRRGKSGLSAGVLSMTPSPWMIRRTGRNRFSHELARTPVANPQRRRLPRLRLDLPSSLLTPRTCRRPQARPVSRRTVCDDGVAGAQRLFAPRHATVGKTVRERSDRRRRRFATDAPATWLSTRCARSRGSISRRRHRSARARTSRFRGDEPSEVSATPSALRQGAPVSRRYGHVEDALGVDAGGSLTPGGFDEPSVRVGVQSTRSPRWR